MTIRLASNLPKPAIVLPCSLGCVAFRARVSEVMLANPVHGRAVKVPSRRQLCTDPPGGRLRAE
eukprot:1460169-Prymnesium_polylepis.2